MITLSASIMAHVNRYTEVCELTARLDRDVSIVTDHIQPPSGNGDRIWANARLAWQAYDALATHHVLIQDDAIVCGDFLAGLERALEHVPDDAIVSPYLGQGRNVPARWTALANQATAAGARWARTDKLMWGVCIVMPTKLIPEMIQFADRKAGMPDDMRVSAYASRTGREVWYTWPSLVDHRQGPSLTKHRAHERKAMRWLGGSALDLDWSGRVVTDPMLARRTAGRSGPSRRLAD